MTAASSTAAGGTAGVERRRLIRNRTLRRLLGHRMFVVGSVLFLTVALCALFAPLLTEVDPQQRAIRDRFMAPMEGGYILGTDNLGRSQWARILYGAQISLMIGLGVVILNAIFGTFFGAVAGYFRKLDNPLMRVMDAFMAFPVILLAIAITAALGQGSVNAVIALAVVYTPRTARIVRASVLVVREMEYVQAARAMGATDLRIIMKHVLPNCLAPLVVQLTFIFAYSVLSEAALSFLGLGAQPPTPTWGNIIAEGRQYMRESPWITVAPGLILAMTVMGLNLLGDGLRDVLDPRLKVQQ